MTKHTLVWNKRRGFQKGKLKDGYLSFFVDTEHKFRHGVSLYVDDESDEIFVAVDADLIDRTAEHAAGLDEAVQVIIRPDDLFQAITWSQGMKSANTASFWSGALRKLADRIDSELKEIRPLE